MPRPGPNSMEASRKEMMVMQVSWGAEQRHAGGMGVVRGGGGGTPGILCFLIIAIVKFVSIVNVEYVKGNFANVLVFNRNSGNI